MTGILFFPSATFLCMTLLFRIDSNKPYMGLLRLHGDYMYQFLIRTYFGYNQSVATDFSSSLRSSSSTDILSIIFLDNG